jgi:hypothetical protein
MGVGHAAVALGAAKAAPRMNVGWLVFAALLADFLLGIFTVAGLEQVNVPADYSSRHYLIFVFPYSHGLLSLLLWGAAFGLLVSLVHGMQRSRVFLIVVALVLSHFLLDGLVHVVGLPLVGEHSPRFGLALWKHLPLELALETAMAVVGVALYLRLAGASPAWTRSGIIILMVLLTALTWGQLFANTAPALSQLSASWIMLPLLLSGAIYVLDRKRIVCEAA